MERLPATRKEAKALGETHYFTGKPCKSGHVAPRFTSNGTCRECADLHRQTYRAANGDVERERNRLRMEKLRREKPELIKKWRSQRYYRLKKEDPERLRNETYAWRRKFPEKARLKGVVDGSKRRARMKNAQVVWADKERIKSFYWLAQAKTDVYGIPFEVDHIVPLQNDRVCGLHNEFNLQVVWQRTNREKSNRFQCE